MCSIWQCNRNIHKKVGVILHLRFLSEFVVSSGIWTVFTCFLLWQIHGLLKSLDNCKSKPYDHLISKFYLLMKKKLWRKIEDGRFQLKFCSTSFYSLSLQGRELLLQAELCSHLNNKHFHAAACKKNHGVLIDVLDNGTPLLSKAFWFVFCFCLEGNSYVQLLYVPTFKLQINFRKISCFCD